MAERTAIEWTRGADGSAGATWTPIRARWIALTDDGSGVERIGWHCEHVSEGCRNCYAESINRRLGTQLDFKPGNLFRQDRVGYANGEAKVFLDEKMLLAPLKWKRPRRIFVASMTDLFADFVPDAMIDRVFAVMALCPQHTFQLLTKRPARMRAWSKTNSTGGWIFHVASEVDQKGFGARSGRWPLPNVWVGVSTEDQAAADARVPELLATPAALRFVSAEPLLGPIDFTRILLKRSESRAPDVTFDALRGWYGGADADRSRLSWVITGGESGPGARPVHPDWLRLIRDHCADAGTAFFHKQWGSWGPTPDDHFKVEPSAREIYRGEIQTLQLGDCRVFKLAIPTRDDDSLGPALLLTKLGKKAAGRLLDGVIHDAMPEVRT